MVLVFAVFTSNSISELLKAFSTDAELLSDGLLGRIIGEEDEGLQGRIWIALLVDAPQDVIEEGLEIDRHGAFGRLVSASHVGTAACGTVGRRSE